MTEATYTYYATGAPFMEVFDVTTAPSNGNTLTSRKFTNPLVFASVITETGDSNTGYYFTTSGATITIGLFGTGKKMRVTVVDGNI